MGLIFSKNIMIWIISSITAHLSWALTNVIDKFLVVNKIKNPYFYILMTTLVEVPIVLLLIPFMEVSVPSTEIMLWLSLNGILFLAGNLLYIKAVQIEDVTRINILWNLIPVFSLIIAWFTINEKLGGKELLALSLLTGGALLASVHIKGKGIRFSKAFWLMTLSCLVFASSAVVIKHVTATETYLNTLLWSMIIMGIMSVIPFASRNYRKASADDIKNLKKLWPIYILVSVIFMSGMFFNYFAVSEGPVSLVYAMEGFQVLFVFLITLGLSLFTTINLKEELDRKNILLKAAALFIMICGLGVLNFVDL